MRRREGDADVRVRVRRMKKRKKKAKKTDRRVGGFELVVLSQRGGCSRVARIEGTSRGEKKASARREGGGWLVGLPSS